MAIFLYLAITCKEAAAFLSEINRLFLLKISRQPEIISEIIAFDRRLLFI
jgi:hypothetical protein